MAPARERSRLKILSDARVRERLRCPACRADLTVDLDELTCRRCNTRFPVIDGVPVLINEGNSIFRINDFVRRRDTTFHLQPSVVEKAAQRVIAALPDINRFNGTRRNYAAFRECLLKNDPAPLVLVVGGSILGYGMEELVAERRLELVATDVSMGPLTTLVCDSHDLPFDDETFDGVIAQAVLEHVADPGRCVDEIHRVLKPRGVIYAETPFMQQVHMGPYDFTRFTHSGHRRLFRHFTEIASGAGGGPGMALAWSYQYFLLSFAESRPVRGLLYAFAQLTSFFLKYFDNYLVSKRGAIDAASGFFFLGRKDGATLSDRELIGYYRGGMSK